MNVGAGAPMLEGMDYAAFADSITARGSGTISSSDTLPPLNSRTAFMCCRGTPLVFHCDTAAGVTEK